MNLTAALLHQVIQLQALEVWGKLRPDYLPEEFKPVFRAIDKHYKQFLNLPTFDELELGVRDSRTLNRIYAIKTIEVDAEPSHLLEYLKNEYVQREALVQLDSYIDKSILVDNAEETLESLQDIVVNLRNSVDIEDGQEPMQTIHPLYSKEEIASRVSLGFNQHFDATTDFGRTDLIMVGGRRGHGKSLTCANIAGFQHAQGRSAQYFTIEMEKKPTLQRIIASQTGIPIKNLEKRAMSAKEYHRLAAWQANRYLNGEEVYENYQKHLDYDRFHQELVKQQLKKENQIDIVYDPGLTTAKIRAEIEKCKMEAGDSLSVVVVDYINQIQRRNAQEGQFDWREQVEVSKELKKMAQEYEVLMFVPYQIDATGEARFAKGVLDAADGSFVLNAWSKKDSCMTFTSTKMRSNNDEIKFTSEMDWDTLKIGPQTALPPDERVEEENGEEAQELF